VIYRKRYKWYSGKQGALSFAPFARKWGKLSENAKALAQQAISEMQRPNFVATWHLLTAWGIRP